MINGLCKETVLNLKKMNNLQLLRMTSKEIKLVINKIENIYKKTAGYKDDKKREINTKIKQIKEEKGDTNLINGFEKELELLKGHKSTLHKKDTLELFINLESFLSSIIDNPLILKKIKIDNIENLLTAFKSVSIFDKKIGKDEDITYYTTNGTSGEPDSAILKFVNGKWEIDFTAASNAANTEYEFLQLFLHPFSLQKALDEVLEEYKDKKDELTKLSYEEMSELVLAEYKPFTLKNEESINEFFEFILNTDIKKLFANVNIIGAYSNKALSFLNEKNNKRIINKFIEDGILTDENKREEIEEIGNWIMMNGQLASVFKLIGDKTKLNNDEIEDLSGYTLLDKSKALKERNNKLEEKKKNLEDKFVDIIKHMTGKMSYISTISGIEKKEFDKKFDNDEWVNKFFETVIKHSTENKPVINHKKIKGNITALTSFIARAYEVSSFKIPELELVLGERNLEVIVKSQAATIKHESVISEALMEVKNGLQEQLNTFKEIEENYQADKKLKDEELIVELKKDLDKGDNTFLTSFYINMKKYKVDAESFLRVMDAIELPKTISLEDREDIENIVLIFKNIEDILDIKIIGKDAKILLNDILMNSFESKIIDYDTFLNNLINNIVSLYPDKNNKEGEKNSNRLNERLNCLRNNISIIKETDNNKKIKLTKIIIDKSTKIIQDRKKGIEVPTENIVEKSKPPKQ